MTTKLTAEDGYASLRKGDFAKARTAFTTATSVPAATPEVWLGLAAACKGLNDHNAEKFAIDRALELNPRHLHALIAKGDWHDQKGDMKVAGGYYGSALSIGAQIQQASPQIISELQRIQLKCQNYAAAYEGYLRDSLTEAVAETEASTTGAFSRSLDIMFGKRQVFLQQPQKYYFPELPSIQFYDRTHFEWIDNLESKTDAIRAELTAIIDSKDDFSPYVQQKVDTPRTDHLEMFDNPDWSAFFLWKDGQIVPENAERCPNTLAALHDIPLAQIPGHSPSILFSLLRPGSKIPPHTGLINARLIVHLSLIIPQKCGFRVGNETRDWNEGEAFVFDDTIQHEAWNNSSENRYVLIFDVETPFMSAKEHSAVKDLFAAIENYS